MSETLVSGIIPHNDAERLAALRRYHLSNSQPEESFNNIAYLMAAFFSAPIALVSLVDKDVVYFKGNVGMPGVSHTSRSVSLCSFAILSSNPTIFDKPLLEPCLLANPLVHGKFGLRFYAGAPLVTSDGFNIGSVCIVDKEERSFSEHDKNMLTRFSQLIMHEIELRQTVIKEVEISQELSTTNERFALVAKATHDAIWDWDLDTDLLWWNEGFEELFGYRRKEIEPTVHSWYNRVHPDDRERVVNGIHDVINNGGTNWAAEYRFRKKNNSYAIVFDRGYALHDEEGRPYRMLGSMQDVTERKKAEEALCTAHERITDILESTTDAFYALDEDFNFTYVNKRAAQLWGCEPDSLIGRHYWTEFPVAPGNELYQKHFEALNNNKPVHFETVSPLLDTWIDASIYPGSNGSLSVFFSDITERKKAEEVIRQSEARTRLAVEAANLGTFEINVAGQTIVHSPRAAEIIGLDPASQWPYKAFKEALHPEDVRIRTKAHEEATKTGKLFYEARVVLPDQSIRWLRLNGSLLRQDGREVIIGTMMDITEERRAAELLEQKIEERTSELKQVNEQLKQFTYSASHDLQEPLRKISYFLDRLLGKLGPALDEDSQRIAERIQHTTSRMRNLIDDLLSYSNATMGVMGFNNVDLNETVKGVLDDMEATIIQKKASIHLNALPSVKGDQRQLRQLFQNLISNALKYQKKDTPPQVQIVSQKVMGKDIKAHLPGGFRDQVFHRIEVKDDGIGFDPNHAERIFQLFQRLHAKVEYEGTGVGLAIVQKVVENHHGYICAEGTPGEGAKFTVLLPA